MSGHDTINCMKNTNVGVEAPCESSSFLTANPKDTVPALTSEKDPPDEPNKVKDGSPDIPTLTASTPASENYAHPICDGENVDGEKKENNRRFSSSSLHSKGGSPTAARQNGERVEDTHCSMPLNGTPTVVVSSSCRTVHMTSCNDDGSTSAENRIDEEKKKAIEMQSKNNVPLSHDVPNKEEKIQKEECGDASDICFSTSPSRSSSKNASSSLSSFTCTVSSSSNFTSVKNSSCDSGLLTSSKRAKERKKRKKTKEQKNEEAEDCKKCDRDVEDRTRSVEFSSRENTEGRSRKVFSHSVKSLSSTFPTRSVSPFASEPPQNRLVCRRNAICGLANISVLEEDFKVIEKSVEERKQLAPLLLRNPLFAALDDEAIETTVDAMKVEKHSKGDVMIKEGEECVPQLYVLLYGRCRFFRRGEALKTVEAGEYFGEIQLMYPVASALATVVCVEDTTVYTLHHLHYQQILVRRCLEQRDYFKRCIDSVGFLKELSEYERQRLTDALSLKQFESGELVISYGQRSVELYFLVEGKTRVIGRTGNGSPVEICVQEPGTVIGELEFLFDQSAVADVVVISTHAKLGRVSKGHLEAVLGPIQHTLLKYIAAEPSYEPFIEDFMKMHPERKLCAEIRKLKERAHRPGYLLEESDSSSNFSESDQSVHGGSERGERVEESEVRQAEMDGAAAKQAHTRFLPFEGSSNYRCHRESRKSDSLGPTTSVPRRFSTHHSLSLTGPTRSSARHHDDGHSFPYLISTLSASGEILLQLPAELIYCLPDPKQKLSHLSSLNSHLPRTHAPWDPLHDSSYPLGQTKVKGDSHGARSQGSAPLFSISSFMHGEGNQTEKREDPHKILKGKKANEKKNFSVRSSFSSHHCSVIHSTVGGTPIEHTEHGRVAFGEHSSSNALNKSAHNQERIHNDSFLGSTSNAQGSSASLHAHGTRKLGSEGPAAAHEDDLRWQEEEELLDEEDDDEEEEDAVEEQLLGSSAVPPFLRFPLSRILQFKASFIWCIREDGTILSWDPTLEALTGYSSQHAIGENLFAFVEKEEEYTLLQDAIDHTIQQKEEEGEALKSKVHSGVASTVLTNQKSHPLLHSHSNSVASSFSTFVNLSTTFSSLPLTCSHPRLGVASQSTLGLSLEGAPQESSQRRRRGKNARLANQTVRDGGAGEGMPMEKSNERLNHSLTCHLTRLDGITSVRVEMQVCAVELQTPLRSWGSTHHHSRQRQRQDSRWVAESGSWHDRQALRWRGRSTSRRLGGRGDKKKVVAAHGGRRNSATRDHSEREHERTSLVGAFEIGKMRGKHHEHGMLDSPHGFHPSHSFHSLHLSRRRRGTHQPSAYRVVLLLGKEMNLQHRGTRRTGELDPADILQVTHRILSSDSLDCSQRLFMLEEMVENYDTIQRAHNVCTEGWQPVHLRELVGKLIMDCIREQIKKNHVFHQRFENLTSEVVCIDVATLPRVLKHTLRITAFYCDDAEVTVTVSIREHSNTKFLAFIFTTRGSQAPPALVKWERLMKVRRARMEGKKQYVRRSDTFRSEVESCVLPAEEKGGMQGMDRRASNYSEIMSDRGNEFFLPIGASMEQQRGGGGLEGIGGGGDMASMTSIVGKKAHLGGLQRNGRGPDRNAAPWFTLVPQGGAESLSTPELSPYMKDSFDTHTWAEHPLEHQKEIANKRGERNDKEHQWSYDESSLPASMSSNQREGAGPIPLYPLPLVPVKGGAKREGSEKSIVFGDEEKSENEKERGGSVTDEEEEEERRGSSSRPISLGSREEESPAKVVHPPPFPPDTTSSTVEKGKFFNILSTTHPRFRNYLRGIRHAVEQQGGTIRISHDEDAYHLLYLFPFVPAEEEEYDPRTNLMEDKEEKRMNPIGRGEEEEDGGVSTTVSTENVMHPPHGITSVNAMHAHGHTDTTPLGYSTESAPTVGIEEKEEKTATPAVIKTDAIPSSLLTFPPSRRLSLEIQPVEKEKIPDAPLPFPHGTSPTEITLSSSALSLPVPSLDSKPDALLSTKYFSSSEIVMKGRNDTNKPKDTALVQLSEEQHTRAPSEVHSPGSFQTTSSSVVIAGDRGSEDDVQCKEEEKGEKEGMEEYASIAPIWDVPDSTSLDVVAPVASEKMHLVLDRATAQKDGNSASMAAAETDASLLSAMQKQDGASRGAFLQSGVTLPFSPSLPYSASTAVNPPSSDLSDVATENAPLPYNQDEVNRMLQNMSFTTLIADENTVQRNLLCKFLWQRKHAVLYAVTYQEMEKLCDSVDILIIDALQFTFQNRNTLHFLLEKTRLLSVVITGEMDSAFCEAYAGSGFLVMPKPVHPNNFRSVISLAEEHILSIKKDALSIYLLRQTLSGYRMTGWTRGELLGKGTHGEVYKAISVVTGTEMAVKEMRVGQDKEKLESILTEITTMCSLQHPNIIHYFSCELTTEAVLMTTTPTTKEPEEEKGLSLMKPRTPPTSCTSAYPPTLLSTLSVSSNKSTKTKKSRLLLASPGQGLSEPAPVNRFLRVFMEYASGGSLREYMMKSGPLEFRMYQSLLHNVVSGLAYIHANQYVHGDIKTANILLTGDLLGKIGDFGSARRLIDGELCFQMEGSVAYMSPECLSAGEVNESGQRTGFSFPTDIWSLGVVAMEIITNQSPYSHVKGVIGPASLTQYLTTLSSETPDLSPLFLYPPCVTEFIAACLRVIPAERATAEELLHFSLFHESSDMDTMSAVKALRQAELRHTLTQFVAFQDPTIPLSNTEGYHVPEEKAVHMSNGGAAILADDSDDFFDSDTTKDSDANSSISPEPEEDMKEREQVENPSFTQRKDVPLSPFLSQKCLSFVAENTQDARAMREAGQQGDEAKPKGFFPPNGTTGKRGTEKEEGNHDTYDGIKRTPSTFLDGGELQNSVAALGMTDPTAYGGASSPSMEGKNESRRDADSRRSRKVDSSVLSSLRSAENIEAAPPQHSSTSSSHKSSIDGTPFGRFTECIRSNLYPPQSSGSSGVPTGMSVGTPYASSSMGSSPKGVEGRYATTSSHFLHPRQPTTTVSFDTLSSSAQSASAGRSTHYTSPSKGSGPTYPHFSSSAQPIGAGPPSYPEGGGHPKEHSAALGASAPLLHPTNPAGQSSCSSLPGFAGTGSNGSAVSSSFVLPPSGLERSGGSAKMSRSPGASLSTPREMGEMSKAGEWHPKNLAQVLRLRADLSFKGVLPDAVSERSTSAMLPSFLPKGERTPTLHSPQATSSRASTEGGRELGNTSGSLFTEGLQKGIRLLSPSRLAPSNTSFDGGSPQRDSVARQLRSRFFPPLSPGLYRSTKPSNSPSMKGQACVEDAADEMASCMVHDGSRRGLRESVSGGEDSPGASWVAPSMRRQSMAKNLQNSISTASRVLPIGRATQEALTVCSAFLGRRRTTFFSDDLAPIPPTENASEGTSFNLSPSALPLSRNTSSQLSHSSSASPLSSQGIPGSSWNIWKDGSPP